MGQDVCMSVDNDDTTEEFDSFEAVNDEVRLGILKAFVEERRRRRTEIDWADREITDDVVILSFSELRDAVGVDDSGRFNYHLDKLVDRFVYRTPKGYMLTVAGHRLAGSLVAGRYEASSMVGVERVDRHCPDCGERLVAMYAAGSLVLLCENDHGETDAPDGGAFDEKEYESLDDDDIWQYSGRRSRRTGDDGDSPADDGRLSHRCSARTGCVRGA
jgi:hypothetical protein